MCTRPEKECFIIWNLHPMSGVALIVSTEHKRGGEGKRPRVFREIVQPISLCSTSSTSQASYSDSTSRMDPTKKTHRLSDLTFVPYNFYPKQNAYPRERRIELSPGPKGDRLYVDVIPDHPRVRPASLLPIRPEMRTEWVDLNYKDRNTKALEAVQHVPSFPVSPPAIRTLHKAGNTEKAAVQARIQTGLNKSF